MRQLEKKRKSSPWDRRDRTCCALGRGAVNRSGDTGVQGPALGPSANKYMGPVCVGSEEPMELL